MTMTDEAPVSGELMDSTYSPGAIEAVTRAEVDIAVSTARRFPRSLHVVKSEMKKLATLDTATAEACIYTLKRDNKQITGPSARFAEIVQTAWGNMSVGARVISDEGDFVVCQAVAHDLQTNSRISIEARRRITSQDRNTRQKRRYSDDMIGVTANAAISVAHRNAVLKVVPKAYWVDAYNAAMAVIAGNAQSFTQKRTGWIAHFNKMGVTTERILAAVNKLTIEDMDQDSIITLAGLNTSVRDEGFDLDEAFPLIKAQHAQPTQAAAQQAANAQDQTGAPASAENSSAQPQSGEQIADGGSAMDNLTNTLLNEGSGGAPNNSRRPRSR